MDSLVQRVNKSVGGTMAVGWKEPNLEGGGSVWVVLKCFV